MPILTRLPSVRTTLTMMRPSMTMFSLVLRESTSMLGMGWETWSLRGGGGQGLNGMMKAERADIRGHALLADEGVTVHDERGAQVDRRLAAGADGDDVQHEGVVGGGQAQGFDV